ncbi:MAG TPA: HlyD family efflux transporter periplasmic adaptor subunit [Kiritimatiellia bacterium]|nr:HlyD family efflux transporter periplasmic adaptor subunit [Lentisphaerota bacterium]HPC20099.1 HlyD family efflux transporter periplasmic adaptor subunit [Kiritimatiellia bacterium]HQN79765.1 HlyD family efflux transporter periplasmic adaptor subunit [Kiritimatiellia bacterium]
MRVPWRLQWRRLARWSFLLPMLALIPFLLWFLMAADGSGGDRFLGLVEAESETVGAVGTVRILSIEVRPGQHVEPGDILVRLDPAGPALDAAVQEARLLDYEQGTVRYRQTLQESERRCRQIVQEAAVALEAEQMNRARDEAELAGLKAEIVRLQPLLEQGLVGEIELSSLRPKAAALEQTVSRYEPLMAALQTRHEQALQDLEEVRALLAEAGQILPATASAPSRETAPGTRTASIANEAAVLRASRAGAVSRIQYQAGDVVVGGEAIVRITAERSNYITGMLTQRQLLRVVIGDRVVVSRTADPAHPPLEAVVESIDPEVMDLLDPFNPAPRFPIRGRRVRLRLVDAEALLVPGETVTLRLRRSGVPWAEFWPFSR